MPSRRWSAVSPSSRIGKLQELALPHCLISEFLRWSVATQAEQWSCSRKVSRSI